MDILNQGFCFQDCSSQFIKEELLNFLYKRMGEIGYEVEEFDDKIKLTKHIDGKK